LGNAGFTLQIDAFHKVSHAEREYVMGEITDHHGWEKSFEGNGHDGDEHGPPAQSLTDEKNKHGREGKEHVENIHVLYVGPDQGKLCIPEGQVQK